MNAFIVSAFIVALLSTLTYLLNTCKSSYDRGDIIDRISKTMIVVSLLLLCLFSIAKFVGGAL